MEQAFCGLLASGGVDCWGFGGDSSTGNGTTTWSNPIAAPVIAVGSEGDLFPPGPPPLTGVASLTDGGIGFCAILTTSGVVCWGLNRYGNLGMGAPATAPNSCHGEGPGYGDCSAEPQLVVTADQTALSGVSKVVPDGFFGWCAVLSSGSADCWGDNNYGELGNGSISNPLNCTYGPCLPYAVPVVDTTNTGTLSGVTNIVSASTSPGNGYPGMCAVLTSGRVDCWGSDAGGQLGNATQGAPSSVPVVVNGPGTTTPLSGVTSMAANGQLNGGLCAVASGGLDCWGGYNGSPSPVTAITGIGGTGNLNGVSAVSSIPNFGYCVIATGGKADCLDESDSYGELGNGGFGSVYVTPPAPTPSSPYNSPSSVFAPF
jgi:hypothetical protein